MNLLDEVKLLVTSIGLGWEVKSVKSDKYKMEYMEDMGATECVFVTSPLGMQVEIYQGRADDARGIARDVYDAVYEWDDVDLFNKPSKWSRRNTIFEAFNMVMSASFDRVTDSFVDSEG
jgi:hypothetical protein